MRLWFFAPFSARPYNQEGMGSRFPLFGREERVCHPERAFQLTGDVCHGVACKEHRVQAPPIEDAQPLGEGPDPTRHCVMTQVGVEGEGAE